MNDTQPLANIQSPIVLAGAGKMGGAMLKGWLAGGLPASSPAKQAQGQNSSGQGSTIFHRSVPLVIFFISVVRPPLRRIQSFTVSG